MRVFISYSTKDAEIAGSICDSLEKNRIPCWIAPRDIPAGESYAAAIDAAMQHCSAAVFIISQNSLKSKQVEQELYLANSRQESGLRIFPVLVDDCTVEGAYRYILQGKQFVEWKANGYSAIRSLTSALINDQESESLPSDKSAVTENRIAETLRVGAQKYYEIYSTVYCDTSISNELIPNVSDYDRWLGDISNTSLVQSMKMLWNEEEMSCLYIAKSGFGKTTGLFILMNEILLHYPTVLVFYIRLTDCITDTSETPIINYIFQNYIAKFHLPLGIEDIKHYFSSCQKSDMPRIVLLLDGLSDCPDQDISYMQSQIDMLRGNRAVQMLMTARTIQQPFVLGNISVQRFDFQKLDRWQVDAYLRKYQARAPETNEIPYEILSNPLILTIYARSNNFLKKHHRIHSYFREELNTEGDVLWNYFEMLAVQYAEDCDNEVEQLKRLFIFRFIIPSLAFDMVKRGALGFTLKDFSSQVDVCEQMVRDDAFSNVFDEYYGFEDDIQYNKRERKSIVETIFRQSNLLNKDETGTYKFSAYAFLQFLAGSYLYRYLLMCNGNKQLPKEFEVFLIQYDTLKYLSELCNEPSNKPYVSNGNYVFPNTETQLILGLDAYRNHFNNGAKKAVSNLLHSVRIARGNNLSGMDLSRLDLTRTTFSNVICGLPSSPVGVKFDGSLIDRWSFHTYGYCNDICSVCVLSNNQSLFYTNKGALHRVDTSTHKDDIVVSFDDSHIQSIALSADEERIALSTIDKGLFEISTASGEILLAESFENHTSLGDISYLNDDKFIIVTRDHHVLIMSRTDSHIKSAFSLNAGHITVVNEKLVFVSSRSREIYSFNPEDGSTRFTYSREESKGTYVTDIICTASGTHLIASAKDGAVIEWVIGNDKPDRVYDLGSDDINSIVISSDEQTLFCLSEERGIIRVNRSNGDIAVIGAPFNDLWDSIAFSAKGTELFIVGVGGGVAEYSLVSGMFSIIKEKTEEYTLPNLHLWNSSFRNLNQQSSFDKHLVGVLNAQKCSYTAIETAN